MDCQENVRVEIVRTQNSQTSLSIPQHVAFTLSVYISSKYFRYLTIHMHLTFDADTADAADTADVNAKRWC